MTFFGDRVNWRRLLGKNVRRRTRLHGAQKVITMDWFVAWKRPIFNKSIEWRTFRWLCCSQIQFIEIWCRAHFIWMETAASNSISVGERVFPFELLENAFEFWTEKRAERSLTLFRFSHGEMVCYTDLKDYNKPNFTLLNQTKHPVLAKQSDNIWYKGRVVSSDFNDKTCVIRFEHSKKEVKCDFHDVLPIEEGLS